MNEKSPVITELKQLITEYFEARLKLIKLDSFEKAAKVTAVLFSSLVVALLGFFLLFFLSLTAGFYLSKLFNDSYTLGFLAVTGLYLILFVLLMILKKELLEKFLIERIIGELTRKEDDDEQSS